MRTVDVLEQGSALKDKTTMDPETGQRRAANRRTLIVLGAVALAFYIGIMIILALR